MTLSIRKLTDHIAAQIGDIDLTKSISEPVAAQLRSALDDYSVLVFRDQHFDNESQIAFSRRFGPLENMLCKREGDGNQPISNITNVDFRSDQIFPVGHSRLIANSGNENWHTDSSFKPAPAYCSMLSGREVPPLGADTQFASCRAAYEAIPETQQRHLDGLVAEHDYAWSRSQVPAVRQAVVRTNPGNGRKNFYTGAHAARVVGWPQDKGRQLLQDLIAQAAQPQFFYVHQWQQYDFVIWDNRCVLHRATAFDSEKYRRVMRRTTVAGIGPTINDAGEALASA
jgi:alpha-ketoglutarate-dependent 2,4-dichlorophenoxyacetate dioxygenase